MVWSVCGSGPIPSGKRLVTIMKKKSVARTSARCRQARIKSRHKTQPNIDRTERARIMSAVRGGSFLFRVTSWIVGWPTTNGRSTKSHEKRKQGLVFLYLATKVRAVWFLPAQGSGSDVSPQSPFRHY